MSNTRSQVSAMISRYSPEIGAQFRKARAELRAKVPRGFELVYDQYSAFGCGYSTTPKSSGVVISLVAYPKWVTLFFFQGARLPDPDGILKGTGSRIRSVRLDPPSLLKSRAVNRLLNAAIAQYEEAFAAAPHLATQIRSVMTKRRPRRPSPPRPRQR